MEITDLRAEWDQAQGKLSSIASLLPSAPGHKRTRSESESPTPSARTSNAARSTSSLSQASAPGLAPVSTSPIELLSTAAAGQRATRSMSSSSSAGPPGHLHRSVRSVRSAAKSGGGGASSLPVASEAVVHSGSDESSSGASGSTRVFDSDVAGNDSGSPDSSCAKNEFGMPSGPLSDAELAALPPTTVPRSE
ncbi:hypothetical protein F442_18302 [Phytophthora nicotianae P10297]|uniref:Uncharacterized protein n=1 Tax=Phytophthora nicotianae P10297 TaxID=1317064 RepID=W2YEN3_PHYNI|nr:hypothetical protein F442_18302 [Phytophthora nicotianae P10297]